MTIDKRKQAAKEFALYWRDKGYEKGEAQKFWVDLLQSVYSVENATRYISFEDQVIMLTLLLVNIFTTIGKFFHTKIGYL